MKLSISIDSPQLNGAGVKIGYSTYSIPKLETFREIKESINRILGAYQQFHLNTKITINITEDQVYED